MPQPVRPTASPEMSRAPRPPRTTRLDRWSRMVWPFGFGLSGVAGLCPPGAGGERHDRPDDDQQGGRRERYRASTRPGLQALERGADEQRVEPAGLQEQRADGELPGEQDGERGRS